MNFYTDFDLGRKQRPVTPFWQGARKIADDLGAASFLWSNLVKVDVDGRRPPEVVEAAVVALGLVEQELAVTQPDAVIFFTGPSYEGRLRATCAGATFEELGNGTARIHGMPFRAVRTYHPRYLRMKGHWAEMDKAVALLTGA